MINAKSFLKRPISFKKGIIVYPPSINQVIDEDNFNHYRSLLTTSQEEIEDLYIEKKKDIVSMPTPFEYLLGLGYSDKEREKLIVEAFQFFIHKPVTLFYDLKKILIGNLEDELKRIKKVEDLVFIEESDFFELQNLIRIALGDDTVEAPDPTEDPRVKRIKAKARYRDKIKAKQGKGLTFQSSLVAICCTQMGLNPLNIGEMSYAAIHPLMNVYQDKEKYELDIDSLLAGASSKKVKPVYWIKNL